MLVSWSWEWASCTIFSRAVVDNIYTNVITCLIICSAISVNKLKSKDVENTGCRQRHNHKLTPGIAG